MKTLLVLILLTMSAHAHAEENSNAYCADDSKKVFVVRTTDQDFLGKSDIEMAEVVARLKNGSVVLVSCFNNEVIDKEKWKIEAYIVSGKKVFSPIESREVGSSQAIGMNLGTGDVLVRQRGIFFNPKYLIIHTKSQNLKKDK
jgi:hypothetical protein